MEPASRPPPKYARAGLMPTGWFLKGPQRVEDNGNIDAFLDESALHRCDGAERGRHHADA